MESFPTYELYDKLERKILVDFHLLKDKSHYDVSKHHRHSYYEIFYFTKGGGDHEIDFSIYPVEDNSIHVVRPGQVHLLKRASDSRGYILLFSREFHLMFSNNNHSFFEHPLFDPIRNNFVFAISEVDRSIEEVFKNIKNEFESDHPDKQEIIHSYLSIFLIKAKTFLGRTETLKPETSRKGEELARKFLALVEANFIKTHSVSEYASILCVTSGHLQDVVNKSYGKSPGTIIHERLMLEAKRILFHSNETVNQVADTLHFQDPSYFARFFKKNEGISPLEFREQIRQKYQ